MANPSSAQRRHRRKPGSNFALGADGYHRSDSSHTSESHPNPNWITSDAINPDNHKNPDGSINWNSYYEARKRVGLSR
jgi:hypothetical protein